jgi:hypothetical protein
MEDRIEEADNVLLVCTELYRNKVRQKVPNDVGHGVCWEANLIYNALYRDKLNTTKFVAVVFTSAERTLSPGRSKGPRTSCWTALRVTSASLPSSLDSTVYVSRSRARSSPSSPRRKSSRSSRRLRRFRARIRSLRWRREEEQIQSFDGSGDLCASGRGRSFRPEPDNTAAADRTSIEHRL